MKENMFIQKIVMKILINKPNKLNKINKPNKIHRMNKNNK